MPTYTSRSLLLFICLPLLSVTIDAFSLRHHRTSDDVTRFLRSNTDSESDCEGGTCRSLESKEPVDSAAKRRDEDGGMRMTSARRSAAAVSNKWKRPLLHQRIRNWQLCPDSIDKVDCFSHYMTLYMNMLNQGEDESPMPFLQQP